MASVSTLPAGRTTQADVLRAADDALLAGDVHRARRLLAEAQRRCGEPSARRGNTEGGER